MMSEIPPEPSTSSDAQLPALWVPSDRLRHELEQCRDRFGRGLAGNKRLEATLVTGLRLKDVPWREIVPKGHGQYVLGNSASFANLGMDVAVCVHGQGVTGADIDGFMRDAIDAMKWLRESKASVLSGVAGDFVRPAADWVTLLYGMGHTGRFNDMSGYIVDGKYDIFPVQTDLPEFDPMWNLIQSEGTDAAGWGRVIKTYFEGDLYRISEDYLRDLLWDAYLHEQAMRSREAATPLNGGHDPITDADSMQPGEDFSTFRWGDEVFHFAKGQQSEAIQALWKAWEPGRHALKQETIAEQIGSAADRFRLADVFRVKQRKEKLKHPAWGRLIISPKKGTYMLALPKKS